MVATKITLPRLGGIAEPGWTAVVGSQDGFSFSSETAIQKKRSVSVSHLRSKFLLLAILKGIAEPMARRRMAAVSSQIVLIRFRDGVHGGANPQRKFVTHRYARHVSRTVLWTATDLVV